MKASQVRPVGNRILVLVNGPHTSVKDASKIVLPDFMQYPQLEVQLGMLSEKLLQTEKSSAYHRELVFSHTGLIGNKAGVSLGIDESSGKEMRLITPSDILLIL